MRPSLRIAACAAALLAALAAAPAAPQAEGKKVRLKSVHAPGDVSVVDYRLVNTISLEVSPPIPNLPTRENERQTRQQYREEILGPAAGSGARTVRRSYTSHRETEQDPSGNPKTTVSSLQGKTVTVRWKGKDPVVTVAKGTLRPADRKELVEALREDGVEAPFFPDRPIGPGDEWSPDEKDLRKEFKGLVKGEVACWFEEETEHQGHPCARIGMTLRLEGKIPGGSGTMTMDLEGEILYALDLQRILRERISGPVTTRFDHTGPDGVPRVMNGSGSMETVTTYRWIKVAGKPVKPVKPVPAR
jgi:hypothetical protein